MNRSSIRTWGMFLMPENIDHIITPPVIHTKLADGQTIEGVVVLSADCLRGTGGGLYIGAKDDGVAGGSGNTNEGRSGIRRCI